MLRCHKYLRLGFELKGFWFKLNCIQKLLPEKHGRAEFKLVGIEQQSEGNFTWKKVKFTLVLCLHSDNFASLSSLKCHTELEAR